MIILKGFLNLVRIKNLFIIALVQLVIKFSLINSYMKESALSNIDFIFYLFSLISIVAGGYIINDIYDIKTDSINKKGRIIIDKIVKKNNAYRAYYLLNTLAIISGFYVAYNVKELWVGFIFLYLTISLWLYSKKYKTSFLAGNLQVAFLTFLSILNLAIFDIIPIEKQMNNKSEIILLIIISYAFFSFLTTLIREIIKDIEDIEGDKQIYANTLVISLGLNRTKQIIMILSTIMVICITYFQYFQYSVLSSTFLNEVSYWGANYISVAYILFIQLLIITLILKIYSSKSKTDFHNTSTLCKLIMIVGILSIPLFTYTHLF